MAVYYAEQDTDDEDAQPIL